MIELFRTVRALLRHLPPGSARLIGVFAFLQGALSILDVIALALLAVVLAPMVSGGSLTVPVLGTISEPYQFRNLLLVVGALIILKSALAIAVHRVITSRFASFEQDLGARLLDATFRAPWSERITRNSTDIVRSTDVGVSSTINGVLVPYTQMFGELFTFAAVVLVLLVAQPLLAGVTIVYFAVVAGALYAWVLRRAVVSGRDNRRYSTRAVRLVSEMIHSLKEITLQGKGPEVAERVLQERRRASEARANQNFLRVVPRYVLEAALVGGLGIGAGIGYLQGGVTGALTSVALFGVAGFRLVPSITRFQSLVTQTGSNMPFAQQVLDEIARARHYTQTPVGGGERSDLPPGAREMTLRGVTYTYPGASRPAVADIDLTLTFGRTVALVGASGSGKSTLVDIILGLLEPDSGEVTVGGAPLREVLTAWRRRVGYVPQEVALFDASVARNVALSWSDDDIDEQRVRAALRRAQLLGVVESRPGGIHTKVGERGLSLSGGQRQRLGVARALFSDPLVLVLDEATSALDTDTEAAVTSALRELSGEVTVVVVAHRLATIRHADQVVFLKDGRINARGTFDEVVARAPDFARQASLAGLVEGEER